MLFKNKINKKEGTVEVKHTVHPNKYDAIVSLYSPNLEGSPPMLKLEGWSHMSPCYKRAGRGVVLGS